MANAMQAVSTRGALIRAWMALILLLGAGCASLPTDYPKTHSTALEDYESTSAGAQTAKTAAQHPGESGFLILRYGHNAFNLRMALTDLAEKTLDVQVYIWEVDETGVIFAERLLRAAERGVRVRLLIDDLGLQATDEAVATMDAHPNIEVRIFNPFAHRGANALDFMFDLDRVNNRMHNKIMVMDNSIAIVGGRNVGDHYFGVNADTNFRDLDISAIGPVVRDISGVFDYFWQGDWAVPIAALVKEQPSAAQIDTLVSAWHQRISSGKYPYEIETEVATLREQLPNTTGMFTWAPGQIVWEDPATKEELEDKRGSGQIITSLNKKLSTLQHSLDIESAYFVVGEQGVENVRGLVERGVEVRVLTNSLASNDVLAAHAGHAKYRKDLLEAGADVYELRPDSAVIKKTWRGESRAGLHTKAMVFDDDSLFIGSFNLDPRSANINTEAGLYVESEELAAKLLEYMAEGVAPENAYRLELDEHGKLEWITSNNGAEVRFDKDPNSTWWQRTKASFIGILPVEDQL